MSSSETQTRKLHYSDQVQVTESTMEMVANIARNWHDPANGNHLRSIRYEMATQGNLGEQVTDEDGNRLVDLSLAVTMSGIHEDGIQTEKRNLVEAINTTFPAEWPTVAEAEVKIE